jgi:2-dehydro-3-deoxygalactonokinase
MVDKKSSGISILGHDDFYAALLAQVGDWIADGEDRILMCGMVGGRQGWMEVPYVRAPAGLQEIALGVLHFDVQKNYIGIIPGISAVDRADMPEVMRGEKPKS